MTETAHSLPRDPVVGRYRLLIEVAEAISRHGDLPSLLHDLAARLRQVASFQSLWLVLHDDERNTMRMHILETADRTARDVHERGMDDSPSGLVWKTQEPMVVADLEDVSRYPTSVDFLKGSQIQSFCIVQLPTAHSRLGTIGFGSIGPNAYGPEDVEFLEQVGRQVAVAIDNALRHQDARALTSQVQHERDLLRSLLSLNNRIVTQLDLAELLKTVSTNLRLAMHCDSVFVSLPDSASNKMRVHAVDFPSGKGLIHEERLMSMEGVNGTVFRTGKPWNGDVQALDQSQPGARLAAAEGIKFLCSTPLLSRNRTLGVLSVGRKDDIAFSDSDCDFLTRVAGQVALAVDNALEHGEVTASKERLREQKLYLQEEIRSEHNFEEIIGQSHVLKHALAQIE